MFGSVSVWLQETQIFTSNFFFAFSPGNNPCKRISCIVEDFLAETFGGMWRHLLETFKVRAERLKWTEPKQQLCHFSSVEFILFAVRNRVATVRAFTVLLIIASGINRQSRKQLVSLALIIQYSQRLKQTSLTYKDKRLQIRICSRTLTPPPTLIGMGYES